MNKRTGRTPVKEKEEMQSRKHAIALALVTLAMGLMACSTGGASSELAQADTAYNANAARYSAAQTAILTAGQAGKITAAQHQRYRALESAVQSADTPVYAALSAWKATGAKPSNYDALAAALSDAQSAVIAFRIEVAP